MRIQFKNLTFRKRFECYHRSP